MKFVDVKFVLPGRKLVGLIKCESCGREVENVFGESREQLKRLARLMKCPGCGK